MQADTVYARNGTRFDCRLHVDGAFVMRSLLKTYLLTAFIVVAAGLPALAQGTGARIQQLRVGLESNDELIARATEAVHTSQNPVAEHILKEAVRLHRNAWDAFDHRMYIVAAKLSVRTRDMAREALAKSRFSEQLEGAVLRKLERAGALLERAREGASEHLQEGTLSILNSASGNLDRAWEFYRNRKYRPALKLADQVEKAVGRLIAITQKNGRGNAEYLQRRSNVELNIQRAEEVLADCASEVARRQLELAKQMLGLADETFDAHQPKKALQALKQARESANAVVRECNGLSQLQQRYAQTRNQLERMTERLSEMQGTEADTAERLLAQGRKQLDLAKEHIEARNLQAAQAALQAAQLALRKIHK